MNTQKIKERFDLVAQNYDVQRKLFIPCYDDYYLSMIKFIAKSLKTPQNIVDLGAGTGLLTQFFYEKFPNAKFTLIDISDKMLEIAKKRFEGNSKIEYLISDYSNEFNTINPDLIISGLSIHHLSDPDKQTLYKNIYKNLLSNGVFINFDQFNADSCELNMMYNNYWYEQIMNSGISEIEYNKWLKRRELDKENTIDQTKQMLREAGFSIVECIYSYMKFGVVIAQKIT